MKVFCIGLSRTGSLAITEALEILGYRSHFVLADEDLEENLARYDAFTHFPLAAIYKDLDDRFPGSKFVLTVRDREEWLQSCALKLSVALATDLSPGSRAIRQRIYGTESYDRSLFASAYDRHLQAVNEYFAGREDDLLTLDIPAGEGFEKLAPFLGKPVPQVPFPHRNRGDDLMRPMQVVKRFLVRHLKAREIKRFITGRRSS